MQRLQPHHRQFEPLLPQLRSEALKLLLTCLVVLVLSWAGAAEAAEVLQVRSGRLLQIGDHNRTYTVELACIAIPGEGNAAATAWLRQQLPRRARVNLRPSGSNNGTLVARVERLDSGDGSIRTDVATGLVAAGLATSLPNCTG
jgi:endonuclease YncB( thermonuclease family)